MSEKEPTNNKKISRRQFLGKIGFGATVVGYGSTVGLSFSGSSIKRQLEALKPNDPSLGEKIAKINSQITRDGIQAFGSFILSFIGLTTVILTHDANSSSQKEQKN